MKHSNRLALGSVMCAVWYWFVNSPILASTLLLMTTILITGAYILRELEKK